MIRNTELLLAVVLFAVLGACDQKSPAEAERDQRESTQTATPTTKAPSPSPWHEDLSIDQAKRKAKSEGKTVFVAVVSRSCPACLQVEREVFAKEEVRAFLKEHTVPIKIDSQKNQLFAMLHRISGVPTLLFLKPSGKEIDRIVGAVPHETFLTLAADFAAGRDRVAVAQRDVARSQYHLASAFAGKGEFKKAVKEYLRVLDAAIESTEPFDDLAAYVVRDMYILGDTYAKAGKALRSRAKDARKRLLSGSGGTNDLMLVSAVYRFRDKLPLTLSLYDKLKGVYSDTDQWAVWTEEVLDALLDANRYEDIGAAIDIEKAVDRIFKEAEAKKPSREDIPDMVTFAQAADMYKKRLIFEVAQYYQVLIGLKREKKADRVAARLLEVEPGGRSLNALAWAGYLTGHPTEENLRQAREAYKKSHSRERAAVADTLARILAARGQREEAVDVLNKALNPHFSPV
ncbi:MAG: thioredoxin fold domain-containing protein [bacterium]|nr:thioredoxin fold domain-containing protein [bacterium]